MKGFLVPGWVGALLLCGSSLPAQTPAAPAAGDTVRAPETAGGTWVPLAAPGGEWDDRARTEQLRGLRPTAGWLIRSPSSQQPQPADGALRWSLVAPEIRLAWNSGLPFSINEGSLWAGRGLSSRVTAGVRASYGPLSLVLAPEAAYAQNSDFAFLGAEVPGPGRFIAPWHTDTLPIDLPLRFGEGSFTTVGAGQSSLTLRLGLLAAGAATESQWWGPGIRSGIVMSSNAPGLPHLFLRTSAPLRTGWGEVEAKWMLGRLSESEYFDSLASNDHRALSALAVTLRPAFEPGLTVGVARAVYAPSDGTGSTLSHAADVLARWGTPRRDGDEAFGQLTSLFGRWVLPGQGAEFYGEWARHRLPGSVRDLLLRPNHTQGYTLGLQWARPLGPGGLARLQAEATNLEQSATARISPTGSFYVEGAIPQGYTHRGRVVGAAIGPGSSSQWVAADYLETRWRLGFFGGRIRWDEDAFLTTARAYTGWPWLAHDVSLYAGLRGGYSLPLLRVDAELATGTRYNYLYQNRGDSWETSDDAVDVRNHMLRLTVTPLSPAPRALRERPAPVPPPPAPPADSAAPVPADSAAAPPVVLPAPVLPDTAAPPAPEPLPPTPLPAAPPPTPAPLRHVVQPGETLFGIARRYGVRVDDLRAANRLAGDAIRSGQELVVPEPAPRP